MSDSLQPHGLQHSRLPCLLLSPGVCSNSCPLSQWCYLTNSSSATPFSFLPSIFPSIRVFLKELALHIRWSNIGASASASVLPVNREWQTTPIFLPWKPHQIRSDQSFSCVQLFATPWITARQASLSITNSRSLLRLTSIESVMPSSHLILCRPLLLLPPIPPSIRVFSNESTLHMRWPKY